ncbi:uncharacterized protein LOC111055771 [Nilaparvata lugens]|uniref:uncharacterized protein LOC111055771 n=1 Tax=Nilaparvata lugens TaxID=108931 RepID=UPI00193D573D|nr:uncharacterized protein LOC111055771 [Nilaparvata lugens]
MKYSLYSLLYLIICLENASFSTQNYNKIARKRRVILQGTGTQTSPSLEIESVVSKDDQEKDKKAAEAINRFVLDILEKVSKVGDMKKSLGLDKKFNIGSMSFKPHDDQMREELIKDVNNMNACINRLFESVFLNSSSCGPLPNEFSKFLNWLLKDGASKTEVCFGTKKPMKLTKKDLKICLE